jgi:hypothetical protein
VDLGGVVVFEILTALPPDIFHTSAFGVDTTLPVFLNRQEIWLITTTLSPWAMYFSVHHSSMSKSRASPPKYSFSASRLWYAVRYCAPSARPCASEPNAMLSAQIFSQSSTLLPFVVAQRS